MTRRELFHRVMSVWLSPIRLTYIVLGVISFARVVTWLATGFGDTANAGILMFLPNALVAGLWLIAGVTTMIGAWAYKARYVGILLTAMLNASVGGASLLNRTIGSDDGVTMSVAVSYLGLSALAIFLPRLTDAQIVLHGDPVRRRKEHRS